MTFRTSLLSLFGVCAIYLIRWNDLFHHSPSIIDLRSCVCRILNQLIRFLFYWKKHWAFKSKRSSPQRWRSKHWFFSGRAIFSPNHWLPWVTLATSILALGALVFGCTLLRRLSKYVSLLGTFLTTLLVTPMTFPFTAAPLFPSFSPSPPLLLALEVHRTMSKK